MARVATVARMARVARVARVAGVATFLGQSEVIRVNWAQRDHLSEHCGPFDLLPVLVRLNYTSLPAIQCWFRVSSTLLNTLHIRVTNFSCPE